MSSAVEAGADLKQATEIARAAMDKKFGDLALYEHRLPFSAARAFEEASGRDHPTIWTPQRDSETWEELQPEPPAPEVTPPAEVTTPPREGETPGWDIQSFETNGAPRLIEVKASKASSISVVMLTENERLKAIQYGPKYWLYLVGHVLKDEPVVQEIQEPVANLEWTQDNPTPATWRLAL